RVDGEEGGGVFRESHRVHEAFGTAAGRLLLARGGPDGWSEALDGRVRPSNRERRLWAEAPFLLLGPDGERSTAEVAVPVLDRAGRCLAALCARGDPSSFPEEFLRNEVAPRPGDGRRMTPMGDTQEGALARWEEAATGLDWDRGFDAVYRPDRPGGS